MVSRLEGIDGNGINGSEGGYLTWPIDTANITYYKGGFLLVINNLLGQYLSFNRGQLEIICYQI